MKKVVSLVLSFTFLFTSIVPNSTHAEEPVRIVSNYLNNGYVYWDSTWSVAKKAEQYQVNLSKAAHIFESIRDGLTCLEDDLTEFEIYYCTVRDRYETDSSSAKMVILPTVIAWLVTHSLIYAITEIKLEGSDISKWYATPYDHMVMNDPDQMFKYLSLHKSDVPFLRPDYVIAMFDQMEKKMGITILDRSATGFDLEITRTHEGATQKLQLTKELFHQMSKGLGIKPYGFNEVYVNKYLDGVFKFGIDFFAVSEKNTSLYREVQAFKLELHRLSNETMAMKRPDFSPHLVKWYKSKRYQNVTHFKIAGGFLLLGILAGSAVLFFIDGSTQPENSFVAEKGLQIRDFEDLKTSVMDQDPSFAARLALLHDEIQQGVREYNYRK